MSFKAFVSQTIQKQKDDTSFLLMQSKLAQTEINQGIEISLKEIHDFFTSQISE